MADDLSLYGDVEGIKRKRAIADALMQSAMSFDAPQSGGRMASVASPFAVLGNIATGYLSNRANKQADTQESAMRKAYADAMTGYTDKGMQALQGTPETRIPAVMGVRPTNNPVPMMTGEKVPYVDQLISGLQDYEKQPEQVVPGKAPDLVAAAGYFAKNPQTAAIAQKLMEKQADIIANQNAPVDVSKLMPYMTGQGAANAYPQAVLTNANLGGFLKGAFAGGGMPKIEGDRMIDSGTGQVTNLPMTANQQATTAYNKSQTAYNWAKLSADQKQNAVEAELRRQGINLDKLRLDPEYQAKMAANIEMAKAKAQKSFDNSQKATNSVSALELVGQLKNIIPNTSSSGLTKFGHSAAAFLWGGGGAARKADTDYETLGSQLALSAERFPGVQTDADYIHMMTQVGILTGANHTPEERAVAADRAANYMLSLVNRYGTPQEKAQAAKILRAQENPDVPPDINDLLKKYPGAK